MNPWPILIGIGVSAPFWAGVAALIWWTTR